MKKIRTIHELKKKCQVIMLPANKKGNDIGDITKCSNSGMWTDKIGIAVRKFIVNESWDSQHLYILSDDEIKEGDWFVCATHRDVEGNITYKQIEKCTKRIIKKEIEVDLIETEDWAYSPEKSKKIIATTDKTLGLPQPSQSFIEKYIAEYNKGNIIEEVMVEYEEYTETTYKYGIDSSEIKSQIKISKDNTITISKIKNSWSREEVEKLCEEAYNEGSSYTDHTGHLDISHFYEWIKENL